MMSSIVPNSADEFRTFDGNMEAYTRTDSVDPTRRTTHYAMMGGARMAYASCARLGVIKVIHSLSASADVLALGSIEVDTSGIAEGTTLTVKWRGKPIFIRHRTQAEIDKAVSEDGVELRDPETDASRATNPKMMVVIGVCTHLGCVPLANAGDYGGWFCPCHGSHYDLSGRIRKGPAPLNLEVPPYVFNG
jgi:ubiquinol-cytochrome c reductase iron-sulfur subunit